MGLVTAAAGLGLTACKEKFQVPVVGANEKINVGLVGCSQRGVDQVWQGMQHLQEYRMHAICDVLDDKLEWAASQMPDAVKQYRDYRELVLDPEIDLVIVSVPLYWHFEVSKAAILAGKHVVCEKSMTKTTEQAVELERLAGEHSTSFKVSYEVRNNPAYMAAKELVQKGVLGEILYANCIWHRRSSWRRKIDNPDQIVEFPTGEITTRDRLLNWRMSMEYGGGLMGEILCHPLDAAEWILDCGPLQRASGHGNIGFWKDGRDSFDNIHANLVYDNNLIIGCSSILSNALEGYTLAIYGRNATIKLDLSSGKLIPEAVKDEKQLREDVDAITGASYKLIKKSPDRILRSAGEDAAYAYYSDYVNGYILDTLLGYRQLAASLKAGEKVNTSRQGKYNALACILANKAMREDGVQEWKPEYGS